jgi:ABC-type lipoprotein export system ATPase subunit
VSLAVGHGELVAIIGGSGSGTNALLDAMSGRSPPSSGSVHRVAGGAGYVPEGDAINPELPLARALRYAAALRAVPRPAAAVDEVLGALDLAGRSAVPVGELSGGERKRAAIAAELLARPALLFLAEPTSRLDPARGRELMRVLRGLGDAGMAVVLTTRSPLDAERCDKVAVLATGGHLAFFGTPAGACGYFGADSLDEIYERLAGLGDPAAAWSRRFSPFSRTDRGVSPAPTVPPPRGPVPRVPDSAGPHSAGPVSIGLFDDDPVAGGLPDDDLSDDSPVIIGADALGPVTVSAPARRRAAIRVFRPFRQWALLTSRNAEAAGRSRRALAALAGPPVAVLLTFGVLFLPGGPGPASFWAASGGFFVGLMYGLPQVRPEIGVLGRERFGGLSAGAYVLAKAAVLLPLLAGVDAVLAGILRAAGRLPAGWGYGPTFLTMLLSSAGALGLGMLISLVSAGFSARAPTSAAVAVFCVPQLLAAAAVFTLFGRPAWGDWLVLGVLAVAFCAAAIAGVSRMARSGPVTSSFAMSAGQHWRRGASPVRSGRRSR